MLSRLLAIGLDLACTSAGGGQHLHASRDTICAYAPRRSTTMPSTVLPPSDSESPVTRHPPCPPRLQPQLVWPVGAGSGIAPTAAGRVRPSSRPCTAPGHHSRLGRPRHPQAPALPTLTGPGGGLSTATGRHPGVAISSSCTGPGPAPRGRRPRPLPALDCQLCWLAAAKSGLAQGQATEIAAHSVAPPQRVAATLWVLVRPASRRSRRTQSYAGQARQAPAADDIAAPSHGRWSGPLAAGLMSTAAMAGGSMPC
jgi:hypothetical protein